MRAQPKYTSQYGTHAYPHARTMGMRMTFNYHMFINTAMIFLFILY